MRAARLSGLLLCLAALGACFSWRLPATDYYRLVGPACRPQGQPFPFEVALMRLRANPVYQDNRLLYLPNPYQVASYGHSRWEALPAEMVTDQLYGYLQGCGLFRAVHLRSLSTEPDLVLQGRLTRFEEEDTPEGSFAVLALEAELVCAAGPRTVWQGRLSARTPMSAREPAELARAMSASLAQVLEDLRAQMGAALEGFEAEGCGQGGGGSRPRVKSSGWRPDEDPGPYTNDAP